MLALIFLTVCNVLLMFACAVCFWRIRADLDWIIQEKQKHYDLVVRFLDRALTKEDLEEFFSKVKENAEHVKQLPPEEQKKKWSRWQAAFGGSDEEVS